jgi:hypothetical protein
MPTCTTPRRCYAGLPFLWAMYLQHGQGRVADLAKAQLLHLYHCGSAALTSAPFRQALVT